MANTIINLNKNGSTSFFLGKDKIRFTGKPRIAVQVLYETNTGRQYVKVVLLDRTSIREAQENHDDIIVARTQEFLLGEDGGYSTVEEAEAGGADWL